MFVTSHFHSCTCVFASCDTSLSERCRANSAFPVSDSKFSAMGKSPGKWIKTVLFGKKSSKSSFSNNSIVEKNRSTAGKAASGDLAVDCPAISDLPPQTTDVRGENSEFQSGTTASLPCDTNATMGLISAHNAEITRLEQAAIKAQTAFRGFLARRAFLALKGIIRLQALVRGHLVRRQAVATLRCMSAIVKFQKLARGQKDAKQVDLFGVRSEKLFPNALFSKFLVSLSTALPLSLQYELVEPNSAWNWLERWSSSRFWEPLAQPKNVCDSKFRRMQADTQTLDTETRRPKRGTRKVSAINGDSEYEKPKRNLRKVLTHQAELVLVQEQPQSELERVKHSLRKISLSTEEPSERSESVIEKPQCSLNKVISSEKLGDPNVALPIESVVDAAPNVENYPSENEGKDEKIPVIKEELRYEEDQQTRNENERTRRRRSFTAKQEYPENVSQNSQTLPSYMAATESAKAKLRAQGSPRFGQDGAENGVTRRLSLPSSTNGKSSSQSPRMQRPVQTNGKGGSKSDRSLLSSRDEKVLQAGWRR